MSIDCQGSGNMGWPSWALQGRSISSCTGWIQGALCCPMGHSSLEPCAG